MINLMIRILPFILIPVLIIAGLGFWRFTATKQQLATSEVSEQTEDSALTEVPKTLPKLALEDRVQSLENAVGKLGLTSPKPSSTPSGNSASLDSRLGTVEAAVSALQARVSVLEKGTTTTQSSGKPATAYIPLGTGGGGGDKSWMSMSNYGATVDPAEYPGYTNMQLEVNFRLTQKSGTAYARLYNVTDATDKGEISTTSDSFSWQTSAGFTLPAGKKTYTLQMKSTEGADVQFQSARIKVNF